MLNPTLSKFRKVFEEKKTFIAYLTAGDGGLDYTLSASLALIDAGVDMLEIGVPFTDPVADGPTIQAAMTRALRHQITLSDVIKLIEKLRESTHVPIILFSYFNPIFRLGCDKFINQAQDAGIDGFLIVDLPLQSIFHYHRELLSEKIKPIILATPATTSSHLAFMAEQTTGFIYYVSRKGTTGIKSSLPRDFGENLTMLKKHLAAPIVAGFGIGDRATAKNAIEFADGFVVGSRFLQAVEEGATPQQLAQLARSIDPRN